MTWETWLLFVLTEAALCLTPGPAVMLVLSAALVRGVLASTWCNVGILAANALYFALSAAGLGATLAASHDLFLVIKWAGAAYLVWLGLSALAGRAGPLSSGPGRIGGGTPWRLVRHGFVLQAANPKSLIFFTAILPQFVDPTAPVAVQLLVLGVTSILLEAAINLGWGGLAGRARRLATGPRFARAVDRLAGGLLVAAGAGLALVRRG